MTKNEKIREAARELLGLVDETPCPGECIGFHDRDDCPHALAENNLRAALALPEDEPAPGECARCHAERTEREKRRGAYWLTPEGRDELRKTFDDPNDGNAVRPLLDALELLEAGAPAPSAPTTAKRIHSKGAVLESGATEAREEESASTIPEGDYLIADEGTDE